MCSRLFEVSSGSPQNERTQRQDGTQLFLWLSSWAKERGGERERERERERELKQIHATYKINLLTTFPERKSFIRKSLSCFDL